MIRSRLRFLLLAAVAAAGFAPPARAAEPPIRALLVIGGCCHDYLHQKDVLVKGISPGRTSSGQSPTIPTAAPIISTPSTARTIGPRASTWSCTTSVRPT